MLNVRTNYIRLLFIFFLPTAGALPAQRRSDNPGAWECMSLSFASVKKAYAFLGVCVRAHVCEYVCACACLCVNHRPRPVSARQVWRCEGYEVNRLQTLAAATNVCVCTCECVCLGKCAQRGEKLDTQTTLWPHAIRLHVFLIAVSQRAPSNFRLVFEFLTAVQIFWATFEMKTQVPAFLTFLKGTVSWWEEGGGSERTGWGPGGGGGVAWLVITGIQRAGQMVRHWSELHSKRL